MSDSACPDQRWQAPDFPEDERMPTAGELQQLQQQAYDEAFQQAWQEGQAAGQTQGLADAKAEVDKRLALLNRLIAHLQAPLQELDDMLENQIVQMVATMVGRLFRRQLSQDPDAIKGLVRDAVQQLPVAANPIELHVHPDDAARLETLQRAADSQDNSVRWTLISDPSLTPGGLRLKSAQSTIDATVEARIDTLVNELIGDQRG